MPRSRYQPCCDLIIPAAVLVLLLTCAFFLRALAANVPGHGSDLGINAGWAHSGVRLGLAQSYREQLYGNLLPDHPPISIIAYTFIGKLYFSYVSESEDTGLLAHSLWIRMPAITADLVTLAVLFVLLFRAQGIWHATAVGAAQMVNPGIIGDSAIWGQIDAVFTMWIVLSLFAYHRKWWVMFAMCYVLAVLSKAQALAILPFMLYLSFRAPFWDQLKIVIGAAAAAAVILFPFLLGGTLPEVLRSYTGAVGHYPALSMNAFNFWWLLYPASTGSSSSEVAFAFLTFRMVGLIAFMCFSAYGITLYHFYVRGFSRSKKQITDYAPLFVVASLTYFAFFTFNTEMHERYLFPAAVLMLPLITRGWRMATACIATMVLFWLNIGGIHYMSALDAWIFSAYPNARSLVAFCIVLLCIWYPPLVRSMMFPPSSRKKASARA